MFRNARRHHREGSTSIIPPSRWHPAFANLRQFIQCYSKLYFTRHARILARIQLRTALVRLVPKRPAVPANAHTLESGLDTSWILGLSVSCSTAVHARTKTPAQIEYLTLWDGYPWLPSQYLTRPSGAINSLQPLAFSSQTRPPQTLWETGHSNVLYPYAPRHRRQLLWGKHAPPIRSYSTNILT
jgi:hypothetical protein